MSEAVSPFVFLFIEAVLRGEEEARRPDRLWQHGLWRDQGFTIWPRHAVYGLVNDVIANGSPACDV